jgi:protein tyrosine phosphatase
VGPKDNWSPPTSSIRSFNPQSPQHVPLDANPDFEAFRRQAEQNSGFHLGHGNLSYFSSTPGPISTRRKSSSSRPESREEQFSPRTLPKVQEVLESRMEIDRVSERDSSYVSADLKRASEASLSTPSFFDLPRQQSPANIVSPQRDTAGTQRNILSRLDERHPRLSLPSNRPDPPSPQSSQPDTHRRADTLPVTLEDGPAMLTAPQLKNIVDAMDASHYLLLDLRVAPQYAQSRIREALNLCIPTTLLKRPSFNLDKLTDTFKVGEEKVRFSKWKECKYIIVYDARSTEKKDAASAINTLKKFTNQGWVGQSYILRGGFAGFSQAFPELVDHRSSHEIHASRMGLAIGDSMPEVAPVAGGCEMPATKNAANPFFSNIRQNMDLVGGVGQIDVKIPAELERQSGDILPAWLQKASAVEDRGKSVSEKFLRIEQDELSRMRSALSSQVSYGTPRAGPERNVQIAGFEKGGKNRYNNIWPFEHSRVHLKGRPEGACDYVNASHIQSSWTNKRYIASQGPLPATFEDFWSVVWDQDVRVLVMLTAESEGGQLKCHPYWAAKEYGAFRLKSLSEKKISLEPNKHRHSSARQEQGRRRANTTIETSSPAPTPAEQAHVVIRKFTLSHLSEPFKPMREITQIHYSSWPDFGAPAQPSHLLALVEVSNTIQRAAVSSGSGLNSDDPDDNSRTRPMLVHCSAGCGRTGTFCAVDSVIDMMKRQRKEILSGVTPMEVEDSDGSDYLARGRKSPDGSNTDWIFNGDVDLVQKTVEDFRGQRISMVQSLRQYVLCYETVLEWISQQQSGGRRERSGSEPRS